MTIARFLLVIVLTEVVGLAALSWISRDRRSIVGWLGLGFVVGALCFGLWTHLLLWIRVPVTLVTVTAGPLTLIVFGRWRSLLQYLENRRDPLSWPMIIIPFASLFLVFGALSSPHLGWDPDAFYILKAKSIATYGTFWNQDFLDPTRLHWAHRRPLLLPAMYVDIYLVCDSFDGRFVRVWFSLFQVAALGAMYESIREHIGERRASWTAALYSCVPVLWHDVGGAITGFADGPLGIVFFLAIASKTPLAVLLSVAGVLLKDEGTAFLIPFAFCRGWKPAILPATVSAAWIMTARFLPTDGLYFVQHFLQPNYAFIPETASILPRDMKSVKHWSLLWYGFMGVLILNLRRVSREDVRWLLPLLVQPLIYVCVWITNPDPKANIRALQLNDHRYLLHLAPLAWIWAASRVFSNQPPPPK